jgi:hypothetical protein
VCIASAARFAADTLGALAPPGARAPTHPPTERQAVASSSRAPNAADVLKSVGVYHLDADLADTVLSLRLYK